MPTVCNGGGTHCLLVGPFPTSLINSTPMFLLNWPLEGRGFRAERNFVDSSLNNFFYRLVNQRLEMTSSELIKVPVLIRGSASCGSQVSSFPEYSVSLVFEHDIFSLH